MEPIPILPPLLGQEQGGSRWAILATVPQRHQGGLPRSLEDGEAGPKALAESRMCMCVLCVCMHVWVHVYLCVV